MNEPIYPTTRSIVFALVITFTVLVCYGTLTWLGMPAGHLVDWGVGIAGFWWLLGIVTIPWNLYFGARRVKTELLESLTRKIEVQRSDVAYVDQTARRALAVAIMLHALSALGFGAVAWLGLTPVGWFGAAAATALTLFRPAARLYRHVVSTLTAISGRVRYPRDDVETLRSRVASIELEMEQIEVLLDPHEPSSWRNELLRRHQQFDEEIAHLRSDHSALIRANEEAHQRLSREARRAAEQVAEDSEFLGNVREIIRFVKTA